jgi:hypothetical protein
MRFLANRTNIGTQIHPTRFGKAGDGGFELNDFVTP